MGRRAGEQEKVVLEWCWYGSVNGSERTMLARLGE